MAVDYNEKYFEIIDHPEKAYWLGYLIGDGTLFVKDYPYGKVKKLMLECQKTDKEILYKFCACLNIPFERIREHKGHNSVVLNIGSRKLVDDLLNLGFPPRNKSAFPMKLIEFENPEFMRAQVCGFFDADGGLTRRRNYGLFLTFSSGTKDILVQISNLLGYGGKHITKLNPDRRTWYQFGKSFTYKKDLESLYSFFYENTRWPYLKRKKNRLLMKINSRTFIEP